MSVKIELLNSYQLRSKNCSLLLLPVIEIKPTKRFNLPHISRIDISVSGMPEELAKQIQAAYKSVNFSITNKLLRLSSPQRLRQIDCWWNKPLPAGVNCTLQVSMEYFDSDETGEPNLSAPRNSVADCDIWTYPVGDFLTHMTVPQPLPFKPILPVEDKKPEINYPGWFAIDFGTSNSTVTLYDPKVIVTPDSLPGEQEARLRDRIANWLSQCPIDDLPGISGDAWNCEWQKCLTQLMSIISTDTYTGSPTNRIPHDHNRHQIVSLFQNFDTHDLLAAIQQLEICVFQRLPWFRSAASKRLYDIYHEVFRVPPLEWQSLISVELDKDRRLTEIKSELEVVSLEHSKDDSAKVKVILGEQARQHRLDAIGNVESIEGKFLHSPKRYFGLERGFQVTIDGKIETIQVNQLLQAAYAELIGLTEKYRQRHPGKCSEGKFYRAVVTYPTIASPFVRREIENLVRKLDIVDVQMAYDEAISVAIFFLWREFGGDLNVGIESFKTRCRYDGDKWWQNVLVLDIGGGTTDLALIRLTLEEINPFLPGEDRGDGGRYYKLTPKLLGSSGHLQLGGELITLRVFLLLKAAMADCLLTAVTHERLSADVLKVDPMELNDRFLLSGKFIPGSLLACIDKDIKEGDAYKDALNAIEKVLPTRWKNSSSRTQTFYTLWEQAENAKIALGQKLTLDASEPIFLLNGQKIAELLLHSDIQLPSEVMDSMSVTITVQQFERAISPVIREAIGIAQGLVENALMNKTNAPIAHSKDNEVVDWLILSGKTCQIALVERELYRVFSKSDYFVWNSERVTFEPEYTKLATSAGACFAEKLRQLGFAPLESKELLRRGVNQLYIDVKNLFYFLPCSFKREVIGGNLDPIFYASQELYQLKAGDPRAKYRSSWQGMQLTNNIIRQDFENIKPQLWGSYNGDALMKKLEINEEDFKNNIKVQFEIDQKLDIDLLLCRGNPHYIIPVNVPNLDTAKVISSTTVFSDNAQVVCDIAVNVAESANAMKTDAHTVLFDASKDYSKEWSVFRYDGAIQPQGMGLIAELPPFPVSGKHTFYFQFHNPKSHKWELIGELPEPAVHTEFPCRYYVSLNDKGILRLHAFEVPYWTSTAPECLKQEGCVFRDTLQAQPNDIKAERDPFSGEH